MLAGRGWRLRLLAATALALGLAAGLAGCGGSGTSALTIGAPKTPEEEILAEIYSQSLARAGFEVEPVVKLGTEPQDATKPLEEGEISGYPSHLSTPTGLAFKKEVKIPADPQQAYGEARAELEKEGLTAFQPADYSFTNLLIALRPTAEKYGLKTFSDLNRLKQKMLLAGIKGCHQSINCMEGLERLYGTTKVDMISGLYTMGVVWNALNFELTQLAFVPSTEGRLSIAGPRVTVLEEDKHEFPAGNPIFVTSKEVAEEEGPKFEATIVAAQKGLTLAKMQKLVAEVEIDKRDAAVVARDYLRQP
jgi:glycine betaine/choline ABC-type transport system substrate-binding protein